MADEKNPITGLTLTEVGYLRETWKIPSADTENSGVEVLMRYFTAYPHNLKYFKAFCDVPITELREYPRFRKHAHNVINAIDFTMTNLETPEVVIEQYNKLGASHAKRVIPKQSFLELKGSIIETIKAVADIDEEGEIIWGKLLDTANSIMFPFLTS